MYIVYMPFSAQATELRTRIRRFSVDPVYLRRYLAVKGVHT